MRPLLTILLALAPFAARAQYQEVVVQNGGTISGKISYSGRSPSPRKIIITKDPSVCGTARVEDVFVVAKDGAVQNVVVYLIDVKQGKKDVGELRPVLDQQGCRYVPHVQVVRLHSALQVKSSDPVLHNVHSFFNGATVINFAMPPKKDLVLEKKLDKAGGQQLKCDVHSFMRGGIFVAQNPYHALTGPDGRYRIEDVPPGQYTIATWHEEAGPVNDLVTVAPGGSVTWDAKVH
jgi:hypothetical protein